MATNKPNYSDDIPEPNPDISIVKESLIQLKSNDSLKFEIKNDKLIAELANLERENDKLIQEKVKLKEKNNRSNLKKLLKEIYNTSDVSISGKKLKIGDHLFLKWVKSNEIICCDIEKLSSINDVNGEPIRAFKTNGRVIICNSSHESHDYDETNNKKTYIIPKTLPTLLATMAELKEQKTYRFSAIHLNIQSLPYHIDKLRRDLSTNSPDVVFLSETWLKSKQNTLKLMAMNF